MMKRYLMVLAVILLPVIFPGIGTAASSQQEATSFQYQPDFHAAPGSAGVAIAIQNIRYRSNISFPQADRLIHATYHDLSEILKAKGFNIYGPYDSYDLIPYQEKKGTDLYLIPTVELAFGGPNVFSGIYSMADIQNEVFGRITLEQREIITGTLMWSKKIPFKKIGPLKWNKIQWRGLAKHEDVNNSGIKKYIGFVELTPESINDVVTGVEQQYPNIMNTISKIIDPEEMRIIKKQCQEIRSKKGY